MDQETFKALMAGVPAPVTVVSTLHRGQPKGTTVSSLASLSLEPPLVSIALMESSNLLRHLRDNGRFAINLLAYNQASLAMQFASSVEDRFKGVDWSFQNDLPRLAGVARYLECEIESDVRGGDHAAIFARVVDCWMSEMPPLIYVDRHFGTHSSYATKRESRGLAEATN
ncbi:flavin reductase family protein [Martelella soudanensis]|uniref:flavin reductase family protein n=1 Tax=unclassified Martelella TaxID=2629616 RepID=UPI0015DF46E2|nr:MULTISPECIES: flavin reductase family protein [unclassified Martelella]